MATITTLIPAYRKQHLGDLLDGLQHQYFKDFRVIVGDDSPNGEVTQLLQSGRLRHQLNGLDLRVQPGPKNPRQNILALLDAWNGDSPLVHVHLDGDQLLPDFYEQHVRAHRGGKHSVSASRRWYAQADGRPVAGNTPPGFVADSPLRVMPLTAKQLFPAMVPACDNWLGELTAMVMSADAARAFPRTRADALTYVGWPDVGLLLTAVQKAPIAFVNDHLSIYRQPSAPLPAALAQHGERVNQLSWAAFALLAWKQGHLTPQQAAQAVMATVRHALDTYGEADPLVNRFFDIVQHQGHGVQALHDAFKPFWLGLLASDPSTAA